MNTLERAKYRGKCSNTGDWIYGTGLSNFLNAYPDDYSALCLWCCSAWLEIDSETVGQFTGLTDKNGADIYEGDLLDFCPREWGDDALCRVPEPILSIPVGDWPYCGSVSDVSEWRQVVSNIHDKPDYMELSK